MNRRDLLMGVSMGSLALGFGRDVQTMANEAEAIRSQVNTNSEPSQLRITDLRVVPIMKGKWVVRIDTNQGISGYGEVRDNASPTYALLLKSRILDENPCNVDKIFRKLKQFGHHARQAGGVVSIEMACCDLAGKAWGVPCWQMLGGKFRDKVRVYADTRFDPDPEVMGRSLKQRMTQGYTYLKMDLGIQMLKDIDGALTYPKGGGVDPHNQWGDNFSRVEHRFTGIRITDTGLEIMREYVARVREIIGWEVPLATDHYGHFAIEDGIKLAKALDPFNLAWLEDMVPWYYTDQYVRLRDSCNTPILTGEDIYLKEGFMPLFEKKAIAICHPDLATSGGLLETKKIGDLAMEHGISMALHMAGSPITLFSSVHCAAATENVLVMEHHAVDISWYDNLVDGVKKPIVGSDGFVEVPNAPGLGVELNEEAVKESIRQQERDPVKDYFPSTDQWNEERSHDRLWSRCYGNCSSHLTA